MRAYGPVELSVAKTESTYSGESNSGHLSGMCSHKKPEHSTWKGQDKPAIRRAVGNKHVTRLKNKVSVDVEECCSYQTLIIIYELYKCIFCQYLKIKFNTGDV